MGDFGGRNYSNFQALFTKTSHGNVEIVATSIASIGRLYIIEIIDIK